MAAPVALWSLLPEEGWCVAGRGFCLALAASEECLALGAGDKEPSQAGRLGSQKQSERHGFGSLCRTTALMVEPLMARLSPGTCLGAALVVLWSSSGEANTLRNV